MAQWWWVCSKNEEKIKGIESILVFTLLAYLDKKKTQDWSENSFSKKENKWKKWGIENIPV